MFAPEIFNQLSDLVGRLFTLDPNEPLKTGVKIVSIAGTAFTAATTLVTKTYPWLRTKIEGRSISGKLRAFTPASIERAIRYYIPPYCQSIDPAGGEESRLILSVQAGLFETLDKALDPSSEERYHILLADSGMGKTSALINYFARHQRRWRKKYDLAIVPLGIPNADERIKEIKDKPKTVLLLDALDEDTLASKGHVERIRSLLDSTSDFMRVLITCRTQFFSKDEEIPRETGIMKVGPRAGGEPAEYVFYKIYLTPFTDNQIAAYLRKRYSVWRIRRRRQAFRIVKKIPHLSARPMLLAHVDDLVRSKREIKYSFELYEEMVDAWIRREKGFVQDSAELRSFSEKLAVNIYLNRDARGAERVSKDEIKSLADEWGIRIHEDKLSGRSLLNRDAEGNFKFAHRSIMEYLFVHSFIRGDRKCLTVEWTDQMKTFLWEMFESYVSAGINLRVEESLVYSNPEEKYLLTILLREVMRHRLSTELFDWRSRTSIQTRTFVAMCARYMGLGISQDLRVSLTALGRRRFGIQGGSFVGEGIFAITYHRDDYLGWSGQYNPIIYVPSRPVVLSSLQGLRAEFRAKLLDVVPAMLSMLEQFEESVSHRGSAIVFPLPYDNEVVLEVVAERVPFSDHIQGYGESGKVFGRHELAALGSIFPTLDQAA